MIDAVLNHLAQSYSPARLWLLAGIVLGGFAAFALLERLFPARPVSARGFLVSLRCSLVYHLLAPAVAAVPVVLVYQALAGIRTATWPIPLNMPVFAWWFDGTSPVDYRPSVMAAVIFTLAGLLIVDFGYYWFHRLQHSTFLWQQHKLHHSDADLSVATSYRHHFLEDALRAMVVTLPMGLVFNLTPLSVLWLSYITAQHGHFVHANLRLNLGWLTPVIVGPQLHRIHHSIEPGHRDRNFGATFPLWDIVFGTYYRPRKDEFPATGVEGEASAVTWSEMLWGPFRAWFGRRKLVDATGT